MHTISSTFVIKVTNLLSFLSEKKVTNFIINTSSEYDCNVFEMLYLLSLSLSIIDIDIIKDKDNYLDFIYNEVRKEVDKSKKRKEA